jgi:hypothetical protein
MKTPRDILTSKHRAAAPRLDAIRREVVNSQLRRRSFTAFIFDFPSLVWKELIFPSRRIWAGLAAVWLLILVANFSMRDHPQMAVAKSSSSREMIMAFKQQQQLLTELIGPNEVPVAEPQKPHPSRPSSQRAIEILTA